MHKSAKAIFLDLSGVLYEGSKVLPGAVETIQHAREQSLTLRFVTNTATKNSSQILAQLEGMGIQIAPDELFTAPIAARSFINSNQLRPFCLIHPSLVTEFEAINQQDPNCVLLGDARDGLCYKSLNQAFRLCKQGAPLIGIGLNKYFKDDDGLKLDAGPFIKAIEWAADVEAIIMGKPGKAFFHQIVASTPFQADECLMVGDDVEADVAGAVDAGLQGCLVQTGKYQPGDEKSLPHEAEVIADISELLTLS